MSVLALVILVAAHVAAWIVSPYPSEDGALVLNWARGYSLGSPQPGITSAAWGIVAWLGGGNLLVLRLLTLGAQCAAVWLAGERRWLVLAVACSPYLLASSVSGLEAGVCVAAGLLAVARPTWAAGLLGALRPDTALLALFVSWRHALAGMGVQVAACLLASGTLMPTTISSKALVYGTHPFAGGVWVEALLASGMAPLFVLAATMPSRYLLGAGAWVTGMWAAGTALFWWYLAPVRALMASAVPLPQVRVAALLVLLAYPAEWREALKVVNAESAFVEMGHKLRGKGETVMLEPAGLIPYVAGLRVVADEVGLVTPWVAEMRARDEGWWARVVERTKPDLIVLRGTYAEGSVNVRLWAGVNNKVGGPMMVDGTYQLIEHGNGLLAWRRAR